MGAAEEGAWPSGWGVDWSAVSVEGKAQRLTLAAPIPAPAGRFLIVSFPPLYKVYMLIVHVFFAGGIAMKRETGAGRVEVMALLLAICVSSGNISPSLCCSLFICKRVMVILPAA